MSGRGMSFNDVSQMLRTRAADVLEARGSDIAEAIADYRQETLTGPPSSWDGVDLENFRMWMDEEAVRFEIDNTVENEGDLIWL